MTTKSHAEMHINQYGNTMRIVQGQPHVDYTDQIISLMEIKDKLYWNQNEIQTINTRLKSSYREAIFCNRSEDQAKLVQLHVEQDQIKKEWNEQLNKMKL